MPKTDRVRRKGKRIKESDMCLDPSPLYEALELIDKKEEEVEQNRKNAVNICLFQVKLAAVYLKSKVRIHELTLDQSWRPGSAPAVRHKKDKGAKLKQKKLLSQEI